MAEQQGKPPVLPYQQPPEAPVPLARRIMVGILKVWPWMGLYAVLLICIGWAVVWRLTDGADQPFTFGELVLDLFAVWIVVGVCVTVVRGLRKAE